MFIPYHSGANKISCDAISFQAILWMPKILAVLKGPYYQVSVKRSLTV